EGRQDGRGRVGFRAEAPHSGADRARMRFRSREPKEAKRPNPACAIREAAASALIWARALAPSVRLTASARPLSGSALRRRSSGSNETGGGGPGGMGKRGARNGRSGGAEGGGVGGGTRWVCLVVVVGRC